MNYSIECVVACSNHLGEGPVWDVDEGALYWVDGTGRRVGNPALWRLDPATGKTRNWSLDHDVGAMALRERGGVCGARRVACSGHVEAHIRREVARRAAPRMRCEHAETVTGRRGVSQRGRRRGTCGAERVRAEANGARTAV